MAMGQPIKVLELLILPFAPFTEEKVETFFELLALHIPGFVQPAMTEIYTNKFLSRSMTGSTNERLLLGYKYEVRHGNLKLSVTHLVRKIRMKEELFAHFPNSCNHIHASIVLVDCTQFAKTYNEMEYHAHLVHYRDMLPGLTDLIVFIRADPVDDNRYDFMVSVAGQPCCYEDQFMFINVGGSREVPQHDKFEFRRFWEYLEQLKPVGIVALKEGYIIRDPPPQDMNQFGLTDLVVNILLMIPVLFVAGYLYRKLF